MLFSWEISDATRMITSISDEPECCADEILCEVTQPGVTAPIHLQTDTYITADIWRRLLWIEACVGHLDYMFQLPGLLLHLGSEEECSRGNDLMKVQREVRRGLTAILNTSYRHDIQYLRFCEIW